MPPQQKWRAAEGWSSRSRRKATEGAGLLSALSRSGPDWGQRYWRSDFRGGWVSFQRAGGD